MTGDATFILRFADPAGDGPTLAVKDLIDLAGTVTTAGSKVVAAQARVAPVDATCLAGARKAGARILGKTNLVELALGVSGINPWYGTPVNPLAPDRIPGGSSSGSAVAVATKEAVVAFGSDTGGSIRMPAACCGVVGLKTTFGRVPLGGVWPLAPSLDSVGPMGASVAATVLGMQLLEPGFLPAEDRPLRIGRVRLSASDAIDEAIDTALERAGFVVRDLHISNWQAMWQCALQIIEAEAYAGNAALVPSFDDIDPLVALRLRRGSLVSPDDLASSRVVARDWRAQLESLLAEVDLLATPTIPGPPPRLSDAATYSVPHLSPVNLAQLPAIALPVGHLAPVPASLQLIGPAHAEEVLVAAAARIEAAEMGH